MSEAYRKSMCKNASFSASHRRNLSPRFSCSKKPPLYFDDIKIITLALTPLCRDSTTLCLLHAVSYIFLHTIQKIFAHSHNCKKRAKKVFFCLTIHSHIQKAFSHHFPTHSNNDESFCTSFGM
jgi:hypothetical protein